MQHSRHPQRVHADEARRRRATALPATRLVFSGGRPRTLEAWAHRWATAEDVPHAAQGVGLPGGLPTVVRPGVDHTGSSPSSRSRRSAGCEPFVWRRPRRRPFRLAP